MDIRRQAEIRRQLDDEEDTESDDDNWLSDDSGANKDAGVISSLGGSGASRSTTSARPSSKNSSAQPPSQLPPRPTVKPSFTATSRAPPQPKVASRGSYSSAKSVFEGGSSSNSVEALRRERARRVSDCIFRVFVQGNVSCVWCCRTSWSVKQKNASK